MNYKETLYFLSKCLTISFEDTNRELVEKQLKLNSIDWNAVVKVSTSNYVFPALYCNLKCVGFLHYLPSDLVSFMKHITNLNRERNKKIITQARELNSVLKKNNINPIFLKGVGNLLSGTYKDIAERMVGDIDFLLSKDDYINAIDILRDFGYNEVEKYRYYRPEEIHYRRLQKENNIAAIEIHKNFMERKKYKKEFGYDSVEKNIQSISGFSVLSNSDKLKLSIISNQINDNGFCYKSIPLRNAYDVFLLSKKTDAKEAVNSLNKLRHPLNCFLAACYDVFNKVTSLEYNRTAKTVSYLSIFNNQLDNPIQTRKRNKRVKVYIYIKSRLNILFKSLVYKKYRVWFFKRATDKNWYKKKGILLGFKQK